MNILTQPDKPVEQGSGWRAAPEQRLLLHNVSWESYIAIGNALCDRPALRMTFDRGSLELMTTSPRHEIYKKWLGRIIETLAEECQLAITTAGQMTFQRPELERGLEPDDCYWIAHEPQMRGRLAWDPQRDPPPDLVLEIEISRSALNRMGIYAALGVPEVWRFDGTALRVEVLQADRTYHTAPSSVSFPKVPLAGLVPFLEPSETVDYLSVIRSVRTWVREQRVQQPD
jgi:Uma2 family endonuclease